MYYVGEALYPLTRLADAGLFIASQPLQYEGHPRVAKDTYRSPRGRFTVHAPDPPPDL